MRIISNEEKNESVLNNEENSTNNKENENETDKDKGVNSKDEQGEDTINKSVDKNSEENKVKNKNETSHVEERIDRLLEEKTRKELISILHNELDITVGALSSDGLNTETEGLARYIVERRLEDQEVPKEVEEPQKEEVEEPQKEEVEEPQKEEVEEPQKEEVEEPQEKEVEEPQEKEVEEPQEKEVEEPQEKEVEEPQEKEVEDDLPEDVNDKIDVLKKRIKGFHEQKREARAQIRQISQEMDKIKVERDKLNKESAIAFKKVNELKEKRDKTNEEISELKAIRESVLEELNNEIEKAKALRKELNEDGQQVDSKEIQRFNKRIQSLEWDIQTTPGMSIEDERKKTAKIEEMAQKLTVMKKSENKVKQMRELNKEISKLKSYLDDSWKQFNELVNVSQTRHNRMTELYNEGKDIKDKADKLHQQFISKAKEYRKQKKKLGLARVGLGKNYPKLRKYQSQRKRQFKRKKRRKTERYIKDRAEDIKKRFKEGKVALSMEEMRVVLNSDIINLKEKEKK